MNETAEPCFPALLAVAAGARIKDMSEAKMRAEAKSALEMIGDLMADRDVWKEAFESTQRLISYVDRGTAPPTSKVRTDSARAKKE